MLFHALSSGSTFHMCVYTVLTTRAAADKHNEQWSKRNRVWISSLTQTSSRRAWSETVNRLSGETVEREERQQEERRKKQKEIGVQKQTPSNKFVFSRCQLPPPSLQLFVRSILFGLASARAVAINFTECNEPLIRLANGACNLEEAKPRTLWIVDTGAEKICNCFDETPSWTFLSFIICEGGYGMLRQLFLFSPKSPDFFGSFLFSVFVSNLLKLKWPFWNHSNGNRI